ncbi:MAG: hypothetical protein R2694_00055 [Ilumatobacteraceae bacterium]
MDDPFDTAAELAAEASMMEQRAAAAREAMLDTKGQEYLEGARQHSSLHRAAAAAEAEAKVAGEQAALHRSWTASFLDEATDLDRKAAEADAAGNTTDAAELREDAQRAMHRAEESAAWAVDDAAAQQAALARKADVDRQLDDLGTTSAGHFDQMDAEELRFDEMEDAALVMRTAAAQLAEAERLDAAAADLEARGVAGGDRVRDAAAQARADAADTVDQAQQLDPTHSFGTPANDGWIDPSLIEIEGEGEGDSEVSDAGGDGDLGAPTWSDDTMVATDLDADTGAFGGDLADMDDVDSWDDGDDLSFDV